MRKINLANIMGFVAMFCFSLFCFTLFAQMSFANELPQIPEADLFAKLAELILNWGALSSMMKGSLIVIILTQVVKQLSDEFKYKNLLVAIFSVLYGVFQLLAGDVSSTLGAVVSVLFTSGGALLLYNALKPFLKNVKFLSFLDLGKRE